MDFDFGLACKLLSGDVDVYPIWVSHVENRGFLTIFIYIAKLYRALPNISKLHGPLFQ
jgi:hypothetical protein